MIVLVPSTLALLPEYASEVDPVADLRSACASAVAALVATAPEAVAVLAADGRGSRVGRHLLGAAGFAGALRDEPRPGDTVLAVACGSARRTEKAPGHLDRRASGFDAHLGAALRTGDGRALRDLDGLLAEELWCRDTVPLRVLGGLVDGRLGTVLYDDAPYGVQYWVMTWP